MAQPTLKEGRERLARAFSAFLQGDLTLEDVAAREDIPLPVIVAVSTKQRWLELRENHRMVSVIAGSELRTSIITDIDMKLVQAAQRMADVGLNVVIGLMEEIEKMPTGKGIVVDDDDPDGVPVPAPAGGAPANGKPEKKKAVKPLILVKTKATNDAIVAFSNLAQTLKNIGFVLNTAPTDDSKKGPLTGTNLTQINAVLVQLKEAKEKKVVDI